MKENLKEYCNKFNPILESNIFTTKECEKVASTLLTVKDKWENRSPVGDFFMSYGALTYLDGNNGAAKDPEYDKFRNNDDSIPNVYEHKSKYFNELLFKDFGWMYAKIKSYYDSKFEKPVLFKKALPGFHIFQSPKYLNHEDAKNLATIHIDLPHTSHQWNADILAVSSFTIAIELPKCGAGLNIWLDDSIFDSVDTVFFDQMSSEEQKAIANGAVYIPYKLGYIYEQTGLTRHQITINGDVAEGERRISVQGHMVETNTEIIIYV
jgi:hypothetical protein